MQIELIAFLGFLSLLLIVLAELRSAFIMLGVIGCLLLIPLAFAIYLTGVEYQDGVEETINEIIEQNIPINLTNYTFSQTDDTYKKIEEIYSAVL